MIPFKIHYLLLFFWIFSLNDLPHSPVIADETDIRSILCSGEEIAFPGRCTGSAYCTACKSCKYCTHCNSGGSCGVCGGGSYRSNKPTTRSYSAPKPKAKSYFSTPSYNNNGSQVQTIEYVEKYAKYIVTKATSLRQLATHKSDVLLRFAPGDEVVFLEATNEYWWKVSFDDKIGWVKKALLIEK
jgi:hypothetical protein